MTIIELFETHRTGLSEIQPPYIIAEAGVNHEGSMELAKRLIEEAQEGGAHAIKFQTYKASTLASRKSPSYWDTNKESTTSQFELFRKYDKFWKSEYEELKKACDTAGIEFMSTPFDLESSIFLNDLMKAFKVSSSDLTNHPFISHMCGFGKPILLSTGASYLWEIQRTVELIEGHGNPMCLMHCILNYPTPDNNAHLGMIRDLIRRFPQTLPGYSDHTLPGDMEVLQIATLLGAKVIEKHFTHDKTLPGNDHYHAMDKEDLRVFWDKLDHTFTILGSFEKRPIKDEELSRQNARRSLVSNKAIPQGHVIVENDLTWKRPASGISPLNIAQVIGKTARVDIEEDTALQWNMFE